MSGTATLAGTLAVTPTALADPGVQVLSAGTRTGTFGTVTGVSVPDVTYTATGAFVRVQSGYHATTPARLLDSRDGTGGFSTPWSPGQTRNVHVLADVVGYYT